MGQTYEVELGGWTLRAGPWWNWPEVLPSRWGGYNWINFTVVDVTFEAGWYKGRYVELRLALLGLGLSLEAYQTDERTALVKEMEDDFGIEPYVAPDA